MKQTSNKNWGADTLQIAALCEDKNCRLIYDELQEIYFIVKYYPDGSFLHTKETELFKSRVKSQLRWFIKEHYTPVNDNPNNTESKEPLYRQLNKERTQGDWDFGYGDDSKALGIYTKKMLEEGLNESPVCLVSPIEKMNDTDKANAQYICLATNNLSSLAEALETLIDRLNTNWDAITAGGQKGILTALTKEAKEALLKIS